ncbi:MAG: cache domain-containing protein [Thermodesulfobacteriota bacterium]
MRKRPMTISQTFLLNMLLTVTAAILLTGYLWIRSELRVHDAEKGRILAEYKEQQRLLLKNEVDRAIGYIQFKKSQTEDRLRADIRDRVYEAHAIAAHLVEIKKATVPASEIRLLIKETLRPIRFNNGRGYFFATAFDGVEELFADHPELEGQNLMTMQDAEGRHVIRDMIDIARNQGEGFYRYAWSKPEAPGRNYPKVAFIKRFEPFDWFIGTGEYLDDVERDMQQEALAWIERIRFGKDGYIFAGTFGGVSLSGPAKGQNMLEITDEHGVKIVRELIRAAKAGGGYVTYVIPKFGRQGKSAPKISYAASIREWGWYVGAGVFVDEIETVLARKEAELNTLIQRHILYILVVLTGILLVIFLIVRFLTSRIKNNLDAFGNFFARASSDLKKIDSSEIHFPEFATLAEAANQMVDARRKAEDALRSREFQLRTIFTAAEDIAFITADVRESGGFILEFSPGAEKIFGYERSEMVGEPVASLQLPEDFRQRLESISGPGSGRAGFAGETVLTRKNGERFPALFSVYPLVDPDGRVYAVLGVGIDMTERKRMEQERGRLEAVVEQAAELIIITDENGIILYVNPAFEKATGYQRPEVIGKNPRFLKSGKHAREFYENLWSEISSGRVWKGHLINRKKDGSIFEEEATITPIKDQSGRIINYVGIKRDVTKEIQLERQLLQTQKMEAIGTLAGGIAHDFNNILSAIIGYTEIALQDVTENPAISGYLQKVLQAGNRARDLVQQILTFSRQSEMEIRPVKIRIVVKEALKLLRASLPATIELKQDLSTDTAVLADPTQIHQIVMNLCTNAAHAMRQQGGVLTVRLTDMAVDAASAIDLGDLTAGFFVKLSVGDTGHGIPPEIADRIFDPFFTTKSKNEGTGMGLSVVHGIVNRLGGTIRVESQPGSGTWFDIWIPGIETQAAEIATVISSLPRGNERILLIDDEEFQADIGKNLLERLGYRVVVRMSSIEALELFRSKPDEFDLVFTDMTMPQMTGDQLAQRMIAIRPDIPIILCTGYSENMSEERAKNIGIKGFAFKPVVLEKMAGMIREVLDGRSTFG